MTDQQNFPAFPLQAHCLDQSLLPYFPGDKRNLTRRVSRADSKVASLDDAPL